MWISNFAIDRPVVTVVLMVALAIFGIFAIFQLETDEFPEIDAPVVAIAVPYPGASPEVVEQEVIQPIEDAIASVGGVDRITSTSLDGFGQIIVEFVFDKDTDQAAQDVRDAIARIRGELPLELEEPILTRFDPADLPIVSLTLASKGTSVAQLTQIVDDVVEPELRGLPGVADVVIRGGLERQVVIEVEPAKMQAAGVSIDRVVGAVQAQNLTAPVGRIEQDFTEQSIRLRGRIERPEDFGAIAIAGQGGRLLRLGEIARVLDATEEQRTLAIYNGQEAVGIDIKKSQGNSTTAVAKRILQRCRSRSIRCCRRTGPSRTEGSAAGSRSLLGLALAVGTGSLGVSVLQVAQALRPAFAGVDAGDWLTPDGEAYDVYVRLTPESRRSVADLSSLPVGTGMAAAPGGGAAAGPPGVAGSPAATPSAPPAMIPLGQIATIRHGVGPGEIQRLDRERVVTVGANVEGRPLSAVMGGIQQRLKNVPLPSGYTIGQGGEAESSQEVFGDMLAAMGMALLLMYFVLVLQFESFLDPFAIMLSLPLSLIGVMVALLITRDTLNIMSMIGVLLLMGIVAKNAILLIDFAKWRHEDGMPLREALIEAGRIRLRPILMTSFALIAGMVPVAMGVGEGAEFRAPMGRAVIGGVITSTLLTLLVIPTVYEVMDKGRDRVMGRVKRMFGR